MFYFKCHLTQFRDVATHKKKKKKRKTKQRESEDELSRIQEGRRRVRGNRASKEGEFGRRKRRRGRKGESPLADYVPNPSRSFTPRDIFFFLPFSPSTANDFSLFCLTFRLAPSKLLSSSLWQVRDVAVWTLSKKIIRHYVNARRVVH